MFTGIDDVEWASLRHAYGSAEDVPGLLRGLASADRTEREGALDGMYGSVHHQGNVYDSTVACVPFLFALAARAEGPDRGGIVELLVSIGTEGEGAAVRSGAEAFAGLAADPDPCVRRAASVALVRFLDDPARVLGLLRDRITVERDDRVLLALTEGLGLFVRRYPAHAAAAVDLLAARSAPPHAPGLRLAALGQLALGAPDRLPADLVPTAVRLLRDRSAQRSGGRPEESDRPGTDTLVGRIRRLRPSDEEGAYLLRTLHAALGDRVADRIALLTGQLTSPAAVDRRNAVWMAAGLLREWRADYTGLVTLLGTQLAQDQGPLRDAAVSVLGELFGLAAPAAGHLHTLVTERPDLWVRRWERGVPALGGPLKALARSGDARAVPALAQLLAGPVPPDDLGDAVVHLGSAAAPLAPALRRRLGQIPLDSTQAADRAVHLLSALTALADAAALPEVLRLLSAATGAPEPHSTAVGCAIRALDAFGPAARAAAPVLRGLLDTEYAAAAAGALWSTGEDVSGVLPVLLRELAHEQSGRRRSAAGELARLGPAARPALHALRRMSGASGVRERVSAAAALWRIGQDPEPVLPVFRAAWAGHPHTRGTIVACLVRMGPAGDPLRDLLRAEVTRPRRHTARAGGHGSHGIQQDEELLRGCRRVLSGG
ncbi:HEAT repeat domain-containing protein [Streptomyces sp. NPDC004542]|uniref:HEAT repeat domain-containing protein n=1 Tax=Streptomyces sp. NPDC004542 TaxID=3154281 RepID=UPI0033B8DC0B